jgi:hypothetical protein
MAWLKAWDRHNQRRVQALNAEAEQEESRPPDARRELTPVEDQIEDLYQSRGIGIAIVCYGGLIVLIILGIRWVITQL